MTDGKPTLVWFRRDLRLADHDALSAACDGGGPVIPVFIRDPLVDGLGAAPAWRLGLGLAALSAALAARGSRLILRTGDAGTVLRDLIGETGAGAVVWTRAYDPGAVARDTAVKAALTGQGIAARSFAGHLLFEPWTVQTGSGGYYRVFTPMWKAVRGRDVPAPRPAPGRIPAPERWPAGEALSDWRLGARMRRGAEICRPYQIVGETAARDRLGWFLSGPVADYQDGRDLPGRDATSRLSAALSLGEVSARLCWHGALRARAEGAAGAEAFARELVWREFAYHLMYHTPHILTRCWRPEWEDFPWSRDGDTPAVRAWKRGRTGVPFVDAAMREMYVTGTMHNRARMIAASYLTKHLLTDWRVGQGWFADCLTDWDPASNAMGWQWVAGCGPDASPWFRIFNPVTQLQKFDPGHGYTRRWLAEGQAGPPQTALDYFRAIPHGWAMSAADPAPDRPVMDLAEGRARALAAYEGCR